jgi:hypothetical protein
MVATQSNPVATQADPVASRHSLDTTRATTVATKRVDVFYLQNTLGAL